jgi:hypothetical protein
MAAILARINRISKILPGIGQDHTEDVAPTAAAGPLSRGPDPRTDGPAEVHRRLVEMYGVVLGLDMAGLRDGEVVGHRALRDQAAMERQPGLGEDAGPCRDRPAGSARGAGTWNVPWPSRGRRRVRPVGPEKAAAPAYGLRRWPER